MYPWGAAYVNGGTVPDRPAVLVEGSPKSWFRNVGSTDKTIRPFSRCGSSGRRLRDRCRIAARDRAPHRPRSPR